MNKHSSLLRKFINYGRKKFCKIDTRSDLILPLLQLNPGKHSGSNDTKESDDKVTKGDDAAVDVAVDVNPGNVLKIFFTAVFQTFSKVFLTRKIIIFCKNSFKITNVGLYFWHGSSHYDKRKGVSPGKVSHRLPKC
jgi:hypothetical protein